MLTESRTGVGDARAILGPGKLSRLLLSGISNGLVVGINPDLCTNCGVDIDPGLCVDTDSGLCTDCVDIDLGPCTGVETDLGLCTIDIGGVDTGFRVDIGPGIDTSPGVSSNSSSSSFPCHFHQDGHHCHHSLPHPASVEHINLLDHTNASLQCLTK